MNTDNIFICFCKALQMESVPSAELLHHCYKLYRSDRSFENKKMNTVAVSWQLKAL